MIPEQSKHSASISKLVQRYENHIARRQIFTAKLVDLIRDLIASRGIDVLLVEGRTKTIESLRAKVTRDLDYYSRPGAEVVDLSGVRIVVQYSYQISAVIALMSQEFRVEQQAASSIVSDVDRINAFGYRSQHLVIRLNENRADLAEWELYKNFVAELQIRTGLEHAWAAVSHKLAYKSEPGVPAFVHRGLARVSAMLEVADEEFSRLGQQITSEKQTYNFRLGQGDLDVAVNSFSIDAYLNLPAVSDRLRSLALQSDWALLAVEVGDPLFTRDRTDLLKVIEQLGISKVAEVAEILAKPHVVNIVKSLRRSHDLRHRRLPITLDDLATQILLVSRMAKIEIFDGLYDWPLVESIADAISEFARRPDEDAEE